MSKNQTERSIQTYRLRRFLDQKFVIVVVALLVAAILGGTLAYQATTPATATEEQVETGWTEETSLGHHAEIIRPTSVFETGQIVSNQPAYFTRLSPSFTGISEYSYGTERTGELAVESTATLHMRAVDSDGSIFWEYSEPLASETTSSLQPGETATMEVTLNVTTLDETVSAIESDIGTAIGTTEILVTYETRVTGTISDEQVANAHTDTLQVIPEMGSYRLDASDGTRAVHNETTTVTTEVPAGPFRSYGPMAMGFVSTISLFALSTAKFRNRLRLRSDELHALEIHEQRKTFDDWISVARVPEHALAGPGVRVESLEDLVDIAIDTNQRVLEDVNRDVFYVLDRCGHFIFTPISEIPELSPEMDPAANQRD